MLEASYALTLLDETSEVVRDLVNSEANYNVGNIFNAMHYLKQARIQLKKIADRELNER